jgi:hypothetical protein
LDVVPQGTTGGKRLVQPRRDQRMKDMWQFIVSKFRCPNEMKGLVPRILLTEWGNTDTKQWTFLMMVSVFPISKLEKSLLRRTSLGFQYTPRSLLSIGFLPKTSNEWEELLRSCLMYIS